MTIDLPIAERRLKNTARLMQQGMWFLFLIAAGLMLVVRHNAGLRMGSMWMLGCAVLAIMVSFGLRDVMKTLVRRNTEDRIVKEVKSFLQQQGMAPVEPKVAVREAVAQAPVRNDGCMPKGSADFVALRSTAPNQPQPDLVVFDAFPARESASFQMRFHPVLQPVLPNC